MNQTHRGIYTVLLICVALTFSPLATSAEALVSNPNSLKGMLLVAEDGIRDMRFKHSVMLITQHDEKGTIALMINHPTNIPLSRALPNITELENGSKTLNIGGPVANAPLMLLIDHPIPLKKKLTVRVFGSVYFSTNHELIADMLQRSDSRIKVYSGYASWAPGQLEAELKQKAWHLQPADSYTIFEKQSSAIWPGLSNPYGNLDWVYTHSEHADSPG